MSGFVRVCDMDAEAAELRRKIEPHMAHEGPCQTHMLASALKAEKAEGQRHYEQLHPASEYREEMGTVLWWHLPVKEPPVVGSPLDDWETSYCARQIQYGWLTHFSLIPVVCDDKGLPRHLPLNPVKEV
jgi:hypothetical protein